MSDVSIALATWNGARFLQEQLESFEHQTVLPAELVVSDDDSADETLEIVAEFSKTAPFPVRILCGDHVGFADNFFRAAKACASRFIAFSDQDDVWLPEKLEKGLQRLHQDQSCLALHTSRLTDEKLNSLGILRQGICESRVYEPLQLDPYVGVGLGHTMIFDRRLLEIIPVEGRPKQAEAEHPLLAQIAHDSWIYLIAAALGRVSHIDEPLCLYRKHQTNAFLYREHQDNAFGVRKRLRSFMEAPIFRHRGRANFYQAVEAIFEKLQSTTNDRDVAEVAQRAAAKYRERNERLQSRIRIYSGEDLHVRFAEFLRAAKMPADDGSFGILTKMKDLLIGVCGLGTALREDPRLQSTIDSLS
jgi:glycosyltransferase involved in cell wall biosynthesis